MNSEWKIFMEQSGAVINNGYVTHFGNPDEELQASLTENILVDLSHTGLISVQGDDALAFLNNQFTNDVKQVSKELGQLNGYCNPQGRLLAIFRIFMDNDIYYLELPHTLLEDTLKRLRMFVLMSKVSLEDASEKRSRFGLSGPDAETILKDVLPRIPDDINATCSHDDLLVMRLPGPHPRFEVIAGTDAAIKLWQQLSSKATCVGSNAWERLDIIAGVPTIYPDTVDSFIPQMLNLEQVGGLSFKKGCYPGQEIVARLQYRGKLKRRMHLLRLDTNTPPKPGDALYSPDEPQAVGTIVTARDSVDEKSARYTIALAVIKNEYASQTGLHVQDPDGPVVHFLDLPYPAPSSEQ